MPLLALYDFPEPMMTAPRRELTTSPLQQLFVMNSPFMQERAAHLVRESMAHRTHPERFAILYRNAVRSATQLRRNWIGADLFG